MDQDKKKGIFLNLLTRASLEQSRDTGLALSLICLLLAYFGNYDGFLPLAIVLLLLAILWPWCFKPLAGLWFGLAHLMGTVVSNIILSLLFFGLVTPVGQLRRWWGADPLHLKEWKMGTDSVFIVRDAKILPEDLEKPY